jgi:hypothetical protein
MAKRVKVPSTLRNAASVKTVWEANPDLRFGNVGLTDFVAVYGAAENLDKDYSRLYVELAGALSKRDEKARELSALVVRFRKAAIAHFGPDSPEYGQAGGTRESLRKSPARKARQAVTRPA